MEAQPQGEAIIIYQDQSDIVSRPGSTVQTYREACIVSGFRTRVINHHKTNADSVIIDGVESDVSGFTAG